MTMNHLGLWLSFLCVGLPWWSSSSRVTISAAAFANGGTRRLSLGSLVQPQQHGASSLPRCRVEQFSSRAAGGDETDPFSSTWGSQSPMEGDGTAKNWVGTTTTSSVDNGNNNNNYDMNNNNNNNKDWSIDQDWSALWHNENRPMRSQDIFHQDIVARAAFSMQQQNKETTSSSPTDNDEEWLKKVWNDKDENSSAASNYGTEMDGREMISLHNKNHNNHEKNSNNQYHEALMEQEIAQLIRCNQDPTQFLIQQGRAIPPLTPDEYHHVRQLVQRMTTQTNATATATTAVAATPTAFFQQAIATIFHQHATTKKKKINTRTTTNEYNKHNPEDNDGFVSLSVMDAKSVASWLQQALSIPSSRCGPHDPRVQHIVSQYGQYGQGYLELSNFQALYLQAVVGTTPYKTNKNNRQSTTTTEKTMEEEQEEWYQWLRLTRTYEIDQVWSDLEMHGIEPPASTEWKAQVKALEQELALTKNDDTTNPDKPQQQQSLLFHDECEILDDDVLLKGNKINHHDSTDRLDSWQRNADTGVWTNTEKSSHELIELCTVVAKSDDDDDDNLDNNKENIPATAVPVHFQDGKDLIYIDEESCIGCMQCAMIAPGSFRMIPSTGRARTFVQVPASTSPAVTAAVASCPVRCMHNVGFDRLVELERTRDAAAHDQPPKERQQQHRHFGVRYQPPPSLSSSSSVPTLSMMTSSAAAVDAAPAVTQWIGPTPMHVSRMAGSDASHKQSIYHYKRNECYKSSACPQKGCYDCPMYQSQPAESNPHWMRRKREANRIRAQHFIRTGIAQTFRRTADV